MKKIINSKELQIKIKILAKQLSDDHINEFQLKTNMFTL